MENPTKQSFVINTKIMKILRWYPSDNKSKWHLIQGYILYILLTVLVSVLVIVQMFMEKEYEFMQVIYISETICFVLKLLPFLNGNDRIKKCISYFDDVEFKPQDNTEMEILNKSVGLCQGMTKSFILGITCTAILYVFPTLFSNGGELPMKIWLPYSTNSNAVIYYTTVIYLGIASIYGGFATCLLDPLFGGLAFQAVCQLKILKHRLQNLSNFGKEEFDSTLFVYQNIVKCIKHHTAILRFTKEYEECFSWSIFNQIIGTTCVLCFICIAISSVPLISINAFKYIIYFYIVNWQILFYCYFGTLLYEESNTLVTAIYLTEWYEYPAETQKLLLTFMERSKRPVILSAEKLLDLTLVTFATVLKRSYSLVAVLK